MNTRDSDDHYRSVADLLRIDGKVAIVTGAGSGLGRTIAETMAEAGASVACADIDFSKATETVHRLEELACHAIAVAVDVTNEGSVDHMLLETIERFGSVDIVFANAGISDVHGFITEIALNEWNRIIDCDLTGVFLTLRGAARIMVPRRTGKIICTSSIYGLVGDFGLGSLPYSAAKAGVVNLTRSVAIQLAPFGIYVNAIAPAFFGGTNLGGGRLENDLDPDARIQAQRAEILRRTPLGRFGRLADIKGISLFLASNASDYCTGTTFPVDGGWLAT